MLVAQERATKGMPDIPPEGDLGTRILLGGPVCRPMESAAASDPAMAATIKPERHTHAYTIIDLAVTFNPSNDEVIDRAWVQILLGPSHGPPGTAVAWSMIPEKIASPLSLAAGFEVKADLKLVTVGASTSRNITRENVFLEALNLLRSDPTWQFARSESTEIRGSQHLVLVVRSPARSSVSGSL